MFNHIIDHTLYGKERAFLGEPTLNEAEEHTRRRKFLDIVLSQENPELA